MMIFLCLAQWYCGSHSDGVIASSVLEQCVVTPIFEFDVQFAQIMSTLGAPERQRRGADRVRGGAFEA